MTDFPARLQINAFAGEDIRNIAGPGAEARSWSASAHGHRAPTSLAPPSPADPWDWRDPRVGWGVILPDDLRLTAKQRATADDAPEPIRRLLRERPEAPVLRYREQIWTTHLHRAYSDGAEEDLPLTGKRGVGRKAIPRFLLICAPPDRIPWRVQFLLNQVAAVGRLWLGDEALERYVDHLLDDWSASACDPNAATVWAVDHGDTDITHAMRTLIAEPLVERYTHDDDLRTRSLSLSGGSAPTAQALIDALSARQPAMVVTTSHGMTGPLDDVEALRAMLGAPVDCAYQPLNVDRLLAAWKPDGAVWYSHACCSAGSDSTSAFVGLVDPGSDVARTLTGVAAAAGARIAPLPTALLSASKPARAFVGHVEPTFDWTILDPMANQPLTSSIVGALYEGAYQPRPVGYALEAWFEQVGVLFGQLNAAHAQYDAGLDTLAVAGLVQLAALDRQSMVIIGDPTVALPALKSRRAAPATAAGYAGGA